MHAAFSNLQESQIYKIITYLCAFFVIFFTSNSLQYLNFEKNNICTQQMSTLEYNKMGMSRSDNIIVTAINTSS